jgi:hypothetical protein
MSDQDEEFLDDTGPEQAVAPPAPPPSADLQKVIAEIRKKQEPFLRLAGQIHALFWELPTSTSRDVDKKLVPIWESFMEAAATAGLSSYDIPQLKECCGKRRVWPDQVDQARYLRLGDAVRWVTTNILRIKKPCEACDRRQEKLNRLIRLGKK